LLKVIFTIFHISPNLFPTFSVLNTEFNYFYSLKLNAMKKLISAFFIAGVLLMISCSKDPQGTTSSTDEVLTSQLPSVIATYVEENYPDADISSVLKYTNSDTSYLVTLETYEMLAFDHNYNLKGEELCFNGSDSTYTGGGHHGGGHHGGGHGEPGGPHPGEPGGPHPGPNGIPVDSIPANILDFIVTTYPGFVAHHAFSDTVCQFGAVLNVMIGDSLTQSHFKLIFGLDGTFLAQGERIKSEDLPEVITTAITTNFPDYTGRMKAEKITLADQTVEYRIFLHKEQQPHIKVIFAAEGTIICQE
jgi:hypothetical protein